MNLKYAISDMRRELIDQFCLRGDKTSPLSKPTVMQWLGKQHAVATDRKCLLLLGRYFEDMSITPVHGYPDVVTLADTIYKTGSVKNRIIRASDVDQALQSCPHVLEYLNDGVVCTVCEGLGSSTCQCCNQPVRCAACKGTGYDKFPSKTGREVPDPTSVITVMGNRIEAGNLLKISKLAHGLSFRNIHLAMVDKKGIVVFELADVASIIVTPTMRTDMPSAEIKYI